MNAEHDIGTSKQNPVWNILTTFFATSLNFALSAAHDSGRNPAESMSAMSVSTAAR